MAGRGFVAFGGFFGFPGLIEKEQDGISDLIGGEEGSALLSNRGADTVF